MSSTHHRSSSFSNPSDSSPRSSSSPSRSSEAKLRELEQSESFINDRPSLSRAQRSSTITSLGGFDFRDGLLPLTLSGEGQEVGTEAQGEEKHVGLLHGMALVVGMQVGYSHHLEWWLLKLEVRGLVCLFGY
jgi:hypothetical protein